MNVPLEGVGFGVVEGFYGRPWSFEARKGIVRLLGEVGLSTYLYAPKSDPEHRERWWDPLSETSLSAFEELQAVAVSANVRLIYGVAPERLFGSRNLRIRTERDLTSADFEALTQRLLALRARGISEFAVLFDDTWPTVLPRFASFSKGRAHGLIAARLGDRLKARVAIVPAVYFGRASELSHGALEYLRGIASTTPAFTAWTGPKVFSSFVSRTELCALERETGLKLWLWNNAIANDWLPLATGEVLGGRGRERLSFGPVDNVAVEILESGSGVLLNGAREVSTTMVALATFAELVRDGRMYRPDRALERALTRLFGSAAEPVGRLFGLVRGHTLASPYVKPIPHVGDLARRAQRGDARALRELSAELAAFVAIDAEIETALAGHPALGDLRPTAFKAARCARALAAAVDGQRDAADLLRQAARMPWGTAFDSAVALAQKGRFV